MSKSTLSTTTAREGFRILSLDGGGAKGVYSLGILKEVEALANRRLCEEFDLIYGTSTGSVISALLALGHSVDEVTNIYYDLIPEVMQHKTNSARSAALKRCAHQILGDKRFDSFLTNVGIVTIHYNESRPMVFKSSVKQAHGRQSTFQPGFGCTIAEAVIASSAAFPFFELAKVVTSNQGAPDLMDGGYVANNPTLLAIADAVKAFKVEKENIRVLSVGTGVFREPRRKLLHRILFHLRIAQLAVKVLEANSVTIEQLRVILFPEIDCIRINDSFPQQEFETDMLEADPNKLRKLNALGSTSFARHERDLKRLFGWTTRTETS
jgi:predicted acylesterase/phospholipase RssA